eukprot:2245233-Amphidinium_carterae.1
MTEGVHFKSNHHISSPNYSIQQTSPLKQGGERTFLHQDAYNPQGSVQKYIHCVQRKMLSKTIRNAILKASSQTKTTQNGT